ncbi:hypothetical protein [Enterobacter hormaechei]|uniref:hypothetical protein n=1 Tax=Enterobacter hormaechei TaxID=158836 RepID=UPI001255251D|nr:hypothetical protein [Enterobacter hormaechei]QLO98696.1 hypothetical protein HV047_13950 [Enterobacter hormaechei]VAM33235.1 Uncharacterised protein [Enterobacter hormaechei]
MKNRKAKIIILRALKNCYPRQWLNVSNRRMVLFTLGGVSREGHQFKNSAAQNRWKNHVRFQ